MILKLKSPALVGGIESGIGTFTVALSLPIAPPPGSRAAMGRLRAKWLMLKQYNTKIEMRRPPEYGLDVIAVLVQEGKGAKYCGGPAGIENAQTLYIEKAIC